MKKALLNFFTLFTSFSTLICCAIPALLVALGLGASLAGFLSRYPQLIWLSEHKVWIFVGGGVLLLLGGILQKKNEGELCPIGEKEEACRDTRKYSKVIYLVSLIFYFIGFSFAYILPLMI